MPKWLNAALFGVVVVERYLPVGRLPGVSLLVRARRPDAAPQAPVSSALLFAPPPTPTPSSSSTES
jgi:hypothetical protein